MTYPDKVAVLRVDLPITISGPSTQTELGITSRFKLSCKPEWETAFFKGSWDAVRFLKSRKSPNSLSRKLHVRKPPFFTAKCC